MQFGYNFHEFGGYLGNVGYILCNIPIPGLAIDKLVSWEELRGGGTKLELALRQCEAKGWTALPLAPAELNRLFPDLWATPKAAEHWLGRTPTGNNDAISAWGSIVPYRQPGQRGQGSRAIIKTRADPDKALAAVLGRAVTVMPTQPKATSVVPPKRQKGSGRRPLTRPRAGRGPNRN